MSDDRAAEAREGMKSSIAGKAKEMAGVVTGRDDLVEEGQLQQAEAKNRKEAVADEAIAEAKRDEAAQELQETSREAAREKGAHRAEAEREESVVEQERGREQVAADQAARQEEAAGLRAAEVRGDAVAEKRLQESERLESEAETAEQKAAAEKARLEREAAAAAQKAAQLRAQTDK